MSLGRVTTWSLGDILTAAALNGEFNNILNNGMALISPATANFDLDSHLLIDGIYKHTPLTFTAQDGTPDVSGGTVFKTANASSTTISMFDSAVDGQTIWVLVNDVNTVFDFTGTNLVGNNGVDWSPALGDSVQAVFINPQWHCRINGSELVAAASPIVFPATQVEVADANTLDDYEEGTWTPSVGGTATYFNQNGRYTKIGRAVLIQGIVTINAIGTGSAFSITGLPFPSSLGGGQAHASVYYSGLALSVVNVVGYVQANTSTLLLVSSIAAATSLSTNSILTSGTTIGFSLIYQT